MAEVAVSLVIDKLVSLLGEEAKLLKGVRGYIAIIKDELVSIQPFLRDADARAQKGDNNKGLMTWVKQVREMAYHIEDVLDEYMLQLALHTYRWGFTSFLQKVSRSIGKLKMHRGIASEIQDIIFSIREVRARMMRYGFDSSDHGSTSRAENISSDDPRLASIFIEEAEIVGIESPRDELISFLVQGVSSRTVISVVGMGGLGKSTLANKVYDHQQVAGHFDSHAWIEVSQSYTMEELFRSMLKQFYQEKKELAPEGIDRMEGILLIEELREYLLQKRYVVVFDDVWRIDFWRIVRHAFPNNNKGSRIIITTRSPDVAFSCQESPFDRVYKLQPLPVESAWELFSKTAFHSDYGGCCPPELEKFSHEIVRKCGGLPLAIVAIAGLLSTKIKDVFQWKKVCDSIQLELESNPFLTRSILSLSYQDLPYYLKPCFLYFGIYPEYYSISCARLIRLWIAEGFVKEKKGKTMEEVARDYLTELIKRNLVQVSWVNFDGKVRSCRVHNLMLEFILSKCEELSFCQVVAEDLIFDGRTRRLSIHGSIDNAEESNVHNSTLHSLFLSKVDKLPMSLIRTFFTNFSFMKVLDFQDAPLDYIPEQVGNLFNLRYLSLRGTKVKVLPKSVGKLHNLQTLDLKHSFVHELPIEIHLLYNLRYLLVYYDHKYDFSFYSRQGVKIQEGIGCLEALQKLYFVEASHSIGLVTELKKLRQLRKLGIKKLTREQGMALCSSIENMNYLESLEVHSISADEILDIQHILSPPPYLQHLLLQGRLTKLPNWIATLQNLVRICFQRAGLINDPLKVLQALPNLLELRLHHAYEGEQLYFEESGFQKLKVLHLIDLNNLKNVIIDRGTLPLLGELIIGPCPQLETVPFGINHMRSLSTLTFYDMPEKIVLQLNPHGGELYWIVEHIPALLFQYNRQGGYDTYTLR